MKKGVERKKKMQNYYWFLLKSLITCSDLRHGPGKGLPTLAQQRERGKDVIFLAPEGASPGYAHSPPLFLGRVTIRTFPFHLSRKRNWNVLEFLSEERKVQILHCRTMALVPKKEEFSLYVSAYFQHEMGVQIPAASKQVLLMRGPSPDWVGWGVRRTGGLKLKSDCYLHPSWPHHLSLTPRSLELHLFLAF